MTGKRSQNVSPKCKAPQKKNKAVGMTSQTVNDSFKSVRSRATPSLLVEKFALLNDVQRKSVVALGFGGLLDLKIREVPQKLAHFVLSNFDCDSCDIVLPPGNRRLHVAEDDVHLTLGLPHGRNNIVSVKNSQDNSILNEWKNLASSGNPSRIVAADVAAAMLKETTGGVWFKRHLLVLLVACLVEHTSTGYINCKVFDNFLQPDSVKDINWCGYVIDILQSRTRKWQANPSNQYLGPILFLVGFYIDRVIMDARIAPRTFPTINGWDQDLIRKRQLADSSVGLFGSGFICDRYVPPIDIQTNASVVVSASQPNTDEAGPSHSSIHDVASQRECIFRAAKKMSAAICEYMELVQGTQNVVFEDEGILKLLAAAKMLVGSGIANNLNDLVSGTPIPPQSTQLFWDDPKIYQTLCEMESAAQRTLSYQSFVADIPSFSIGLTQAETHVFKSGVEMDLCNADTPISLKQSKSVVNGNEVEGQCGAHDANKTINVVPEVASDRVIELRSKSSMVKGKSLVAGSPVASPSVSEVSITDAGAKGKSIQKQDIDIVKRSTRDSKKPVTFSSPFFVRAADPSQRLTKEEKEIFCWIFHNDDADKFECVFRCNRVRVQRIDMKTLAPTIGICTFVIDVWSIVLNSRENLRAPTSPFRFFASTSPAVPAILAANFPKNMSVNESKFIEFLDADLNRFGNVDISKVQVFFFPCHVNTNYFLICVTLLKSKIDVIDGSDAYDVDESDTALYGNIPATLRNYFSKFLKARGFASKGGSVSKFEIKILRMPWRDRTNIDDIGLFLMRHMETYMGESQDRWESGLRKGWRKQLKYLRARYAHAILLSDVNLEVKNIRGASKAHYINFTKKESF